jgi:hypothetical protein
MAEVQGLVRCNDCGSEAAYEGELIHGGCAEPFNLVEVRLFEDRDIQPLVEAARKMITPLSPAAFLKETETERVARFDALRDALKPFDSKEDTTQGGDAHELPDRGLDSADVTEPGVVDDGSRLQELLEWVQWQAKLEAPTSASPDERGEWKGASAAYRYVADRIHQLQANEEKGQ